MFANKVEPLADMKHHFTVSGKSEEVCIGEMTANLFGNIYKVCSSEFSGTRDSILHGSIVTMAKENMASVVCV